MVVAWHTRSPSSHARAKWHPALNTMPQNYADGLVHDSSIHVTKVYAMRSRWARDAWGKTFNTSSVRCGLTLAMASVAQENTAAIEVYLLGGRDALFELC